MTGSEPGQGTGSAVALVIYGNIGLSEKLVIGDDENFNFSEGKSEDFQVNYKSDRYRFFTSKNRISVIVLFDVKKLITFCLIYISLFNLISKTAKRS